MAIDFQCVHLQEAVLLNNIQVLVGPPRTVQVHGEDFRSVDEVLINGAPSPDVVVVSKTQLLAQVPSSMLQQRVLSVVVLSKRLTVTPKSILRFQIGSTPGKVTGILKLTQKFLKILFTTPGTDIFNPTLGGGALKNIGATFGQSEGDSVFHNLVIAIDTTTRQIIGIQSRNASLPLDERLLSAKVLRAGFNKEESAVDVALEINSQAGRAAVANLEL